MSKKIIFEAGRLFRALCLSSSSFDGIDCGSQQSKKTALANAGGDVMRKLFTVGMLALLCSSAAAEVAQEDAAYFCVAEIAGGLAYDEVGRKWHGAVFKATERFVLRLKFVDTQKGVLSNDKDTIYKNFSVTVTEAGSNIATPCIQLGVDRPTVPIGNYPGFTCYVGYSEHSFNLANNRYLKVYDIGYTDGHDNNENTPAVSGGVCTKIDLVNDVRRASP